MRKPAAASSGWISGFGPSPLNWTESPEPKNEERLAGQVARPLLVA